MKSVKTTRPKDPPLKGIRATCGVTTKFGKPCGAHAGAGTDHKGVGPCFRHGGRTGSKYGGMLVGKTQLVSGRDVMGIPVEIDPAVALLRCVEIAAGEVEYCSARVRELEDPFIVRRDSTTGEETARRFHPWIRERQDCVDRLARLSKMAMDAGVAEREVRAREAATAILGTFARGLLDNLGLSKDQLARAPKIVEEQLLLLATTGGELRERP